ncbi:hypothetical protein JB92DRAFT_2830880 [Gautieria morchelliformis]|nr:hypothetical protein JB92DRAFT_2830880 [Gautieria morchelliformis]
MKKRNVRQGREEKGLWPARTPVERGRNCPSGQTGDLDNEGHGGDDEGQEGGERNERGRGSSKTGAGQASRRANEEKDTEQTIAPAWKHTAPGKGDGNAGMIKRWQGRQETGNVGEAGEQLEWVAQPGNNEGNRLGGGDGEARGAPERRRERGDDKKVAGTSGSTGLGKETGTRDDKKAAGTPVREWGSARETEDAHTVGENARENV